MKLYYNSENIEESFVFLSETDCSSDDFADEFADELALGLSVLMIKAMKEGFPNKGEHFLVGDMTMERMEENLAEWRYGVFEI